MPFWGTLHITMHTWASRYQRTGLTCLAAQLPRRAGPPRLHTILVLLSFLTFVATSSPHRVHHLGEAHPPQRLIHHHHVSHGHDPHHDHPAPADQPASQPHDGQPPPLPECVVLFLLQSLPVLGAEWALVSAPIAPQPLEKPTPWCCPLDVHTNAIQSRAPL